MDIALTFVTAKNKKVRDQQQGRVSVDKMPP